jgi:nucleoid-associated protein YgaU
MPQPHPAAGAPEQDAAVETGAAQEMEAASEPDEVEEKPLSEEEARDMLRKHQQAYRQRIEDAKIKIRTRAEWRRAKRLGETYTYTVQPGDTLETVAKMFYAKAERWPELYEANATRLPGPAELHPQPLEPGTELVIP